MTDREMRIAIAESCGWDVARNDWPRPMGYLNGQGPLLVIPDYICDLNAMAEAERTLDVNRLSAYADHLDAICVPVHICPLTHWQSVICSTARQRAEAFVKAITPIL